MALIRSSNMTKILLMTSNGLRHRYAANMLAKQLDLCAIVAEVKAPITLHLQKNEAESEIIKQHFAQRDISEKKILVDNWEFPVKSDLLNVQSGTSNAIEVFEWVKNHNPEVIILYGTSIIKAPLLDHFNNRMINLHLGLSPYYRGSGTNFWPLVDNLPECVGATIHLATLTVDAGSILTQVRPDGIREDDGPHELGTKTIVTALKQFGWLIRAYLRNEITPIKQNLTIGKVCKRKDFTPEAVIKMQKNFQQGMISNYINQKPHRDCNYPIVHISK
jgi:methionyl-tRNA formyltransferase